MITPLIVFRTSGHILSNSTRFGFSDMFLVLLSVVEFLFADYAPLPSSWHSLSSSLEPKAYYYWTFCIIIHYLLVPKNTIFKNQIWTHTCTHTHTHTHTECIDLLHLNAGRHDWLSLVTQGEGGKHSLSSIKFTWPMIPDVEMIYKYVCMSLLSVVTSFLRKPLLAGFKLEPLITNIVTSLPIFTGSQGA